MIYSCSILEHLPLRTLLTSGQVHARRTVATPTSSSTPKSSLKKTTLEHPASYKGILFPRCVELSEV
jgi:hypothetical protein